MHNIEISKEHQACLNAHWDIQWKTFVLLFFCLKTSKHPLNTTRANDAVIPGQDQGSYPNDSTMPATNQRHILQTIIIRFQVLARNDNLATCAIS